MFADMEQMGHEQVVYCFDQTTGLHALIGIHSTALGPALGGCRMWNYANEHEALRDVLRLSRGMTYKAALAGLALGGGKSVIFGDPVKDKSEALLRSFGRFVNSLGGKYITAQDVSISNTDLLHMHKETKHVVGLPAKMGGTGDPSPMTALGVFSGIRAAVAHRLQKNSLRGVRVAVQGCGSVGNKLCHLLHNEGAELWIGDIDANKIAPLVASCGAKVMTSDALLRAEVDVFAPCALGAILDDDSIPQLQAKIVAGGANNQLADEKMHDEMLRARNILYAPDYVINAGGLISVSYEVKKRAGTAAAKTKAIYDTLLEIFHRAEQQSEGTGKTANRLAEERVRRHARDAASNQQRLIG